MHTVLALTAACGLAVVSSAVASAWSAHAALAAPTASARPSAPTADDGGLLSILVLGDSYSAGNGAGHYYGALGCRRSPYNYARQFQRLVEAAPYRQRAFVENRACSGDTTAAVTSATSGRAPQKDAVNGGYDLILVTLGGNDINFRGIVKYCLVGGTRNGANCGPLLTAAEKKASNGGTLGASLTTALVAIKQHADPRAKIVVLGYPYLEGDPSYRLRSGHGGSTFIDAGKRIRAIGDQGDRLQQAAVDKINRRAGARLVFVPTKRLFAGPPNRELFASHANKKRWFIQPGKDAGVQDFDIWYHPNYTGWLQEARLLLADTRVPKKDLNTDRPGPTPTPITTTHPPTHGAPQPVNAYDQYGPATAGHAMCRGNPSRSESLPGGTVSEQFAVPAGGATLDKALVQIDPDSAVTAHATLNVNGVERAADAVAAGDTTFAFAPVSVHQGDQVTLTVTFTATSGKIITVYTVGQPAGTLTIRNSCPDGAPNVGPTSDALRAVVSGTT